MLSVKRIMSIETEYALSDFPAGGAAASGSAREPAASGAGTSVPAKAPSNAPTETEVAQQAEALAQRLLRTWALAEAKTSGVPVTNHVPDPAGAAVSWRMLPGAGTRFDYSGEHPELDAEGKAHRDLPPEARTNEELGAVLTGVKTRWVTKVDAFGQHYYRGNSTIAPNGARLYVDHGHPEYSAPECLGPLQAALYDRAGDEIMTRAAAALRENTSDSEAGARALILKNNTDERGSAWGAHENYLVERRVEWQLLVDLFMPFLVSRPIFCGTGRLGLGPNSETPGFQIFQRADFIETEVSLMTTRERPIVNTRDEPHASRRYRRFHVITADSSMFPYSAALRTGTAALLLSLAESFPERARELADRWALQDPVSAIQAFSRDVTLRQSCPLKRGGVATGLEIQQGYLEFIRDVGFEEGSGGYQQADRETKWVIENWERVLTSLARGWQEATALVEWCAKLALLDRKRTQLGCDWDDPRLSLLNLRFSMIDEGLSLARALEKGGFEPLYSREEIRKASFEAPPETRAGGRAELLRRFPDQLWAASWMAILVDIGKRQLVRVQFPDPHHPTRLEVQKAIEICEKKLGPESEDQGKLVAEVLEVLGVELPADLKYYSWDEGYYASESFKEQFEKGK